MLLVYTRFVSFTSGFDLALSAYDYLQMRTLLRSYNSRPIAEIVAARLRELDIPLVVMSTGTLEAYVGGAGEAEIWLEDDAILENETWRNQIETVLNGDTTTLTPAEEEFIANMPLLDTPPKSENEKGQV